MVGASVSDDDCVGVSEVTGGSSLPVGDSIVKGGSSMLGAYPDVPVATSEVAVSELALVPSTEVGSPVGEVSVVVLS